MSQTIVNRLTDETLTVYLELGDDLWLRNEAGEIEHAQRAQLPAERWRFEGVRVAGDDIPRLTINCNFPPLPAGLVELFEGATTFALASIAP